MPRHLVLPVVLLGLAGCGQPPPSTQPAPPAPAEEQPPVVRPHPGVTGDPADPVFAGRKLSEWRAALRQSQDAVKKLTAQRVITEVYGPAAVAALPDILQYTTPPASGGPYPPFAVDQEAFVRTIGKPAAQHLEAALTSPDLVTRARAAGLFKALGANGAASVPAVVEALKHPDPNVRGPARGAARAIGPAAKAAVPLLTEALKDPDAYTRWDAALAISAVDPTVGEAVPILLAPPPHYPVDRRPVIRFGGIAVPALVKLLRRPDGRLDPEIVGLLRAIGPGAAPAVPELVELAKENKHPGEAATCCEAIEAVGPAAKDAGPDLLQLAKTGPPDCRPRAAAAAVNAGVPAADVVPILEETGRWGGRVEADGWRVLAQLGPEAKATAIRRCKSALADPPEGRKYLAATTLAEIDPSDPDACRVLLELTESKDPSTKHSTQIALDRLPAAAAAGLKPHLSHPKPSLRVLAARLVIRRDPIDATASKLLKDDVYIETPSSSPTFPPTVVINHLDDFRTAGRGGVPHLAELLTHSRPLVREEAARTLARMGPGAAPAAVALAKAAGEDDDKLRFAALTALGRIGPAAKPHVEAAKAHLRAADVFVRFAAAEAVTILDPTDRTAVPVLVELLKLDNLRAAFERARGQPSFNPPPKPDGPPPPTTGGTLPDYRAAVANALFGADPEAAVKGDVFTHVIHLAPRRWPK